MQWLPVAREVSPGLLTNEDPRLRGAWHPVALTGELPCDVTLLGSRYSLVSREGVLHVQPEPWAVTERWGLVWIAPEEPRTELFLDADTADRTSVGAWLPPVRTPASADVELSEFMHARTFGAAEENQIPRYAVSTGPDGFKSADDRGATYVYRAPFQLLLRLEEPDAVRTILFFAQPETLTSTRVYTKLLLHGVADPGPEVVAREVAVLAEDLEVHRAMRQLLSPHDHADLLGVTLRRILADFVNGP
ncbi:hypothetical protein [Actinoplanes friuliensis]|uniref:Rieske (2Fe-2S) iron-sulfur domain-containing protein n=1 Tax=Actinoplanes friuliensis DSM 7358 TaxID=1246995 RepID=U5W2Z0_9ACTN|nr:hypothetical protein [Actinoplanes friuliensis]AGZ43499.1 Rieske (2Fe-2S) iron-sulfur domain-containing protein [Actinoplanes friuliensis DSM 7358]